MTSAAEDELTHLEELAAVLQRRRRILEIHRVRFGDLVPTSIVLELEDTERQLAQIHADLRRMRPSPTDIHSPYLGLLTFQEDDSTFFFGRDVLIGELLSKAEQTSFLVVLGPSGSGKSSVVRAGLIPALKRAALPGSEQWQYLAPLKPGARPLNALAAALTAAQEGRLSDIAAIHETLKKKPDALLLMTDGLLSGHTNARLVLVVDQAEELWTLAPIEPAARTAFLTDQQQPFINCLVAAASAPDHAVLIILTMRADFLHRALEHQELASWTKTHNVLVQPLTRDELQSAITHPAELVGGGFEPGLVDILVEQTISRPGALPLLEYTLLELWKERQPDGTLTWEAFKHIGGGVEGGLARRADSVLAKQYTPEQQAELRAVLLRLVQPGEGAVDTRRRVPLDDLVPAGSSSEAVQALLKPLTDERLITTGYNAESDEEIVEISHEALIRAWPTLGSWISTARGDLRLQIQLGEAAKDWVTSGENPDLLWSGLRLNIAEVWLERARPRLNARDQRFLDASRTQRQAEIETEQARIAAEEAARRRELDQARALAAGAVRLRRRNIFLGAALIATIVVAALAGWFWYRATMSEQRAFAQLLVAKGQTLYEERPLLGMRLALEGLAWLPKNDPARADHTSTVLQLAKLGRLQKLADDGSGIYASPDGTIFMLAHTDAPGELRNINDGSLIATLADKVSNPVNLSCTIGGGECSPITFSPDSKQFVVHYSDKPSELRRADGSLVTALVTNVSYVTFSPDSKQLVVQYNDKPSELRRADGSLVTALDGVVSIITFSSDSKRFVVQYSDKPIELRGIDGNLVTTLAANPQNVTFSPDSQLFVVQYSDMPSELRRADGSLVMTVVTSASLFPNSPFTFSPDNQLFVVVHSDKPGELRHVDGSLVTTLAANPQNVTFSPDSQLFVAHYMDKPSELRRADGSLVALLGTNIYVVTFSPDSKEFVVPYTDKPSELRRADGSLVATLASYLTSVTFSPDSQLFVPVYEDKPSELRRADGSLVITLANYSSIQTFSPNSQLFVVASANNPDELWEAKSSVRHLATFPNLDKIIYDPKATRIIVAQSTGQVYILDIEWLNIAANYPETLRETELIEQICSKILSSLQFNEAELQPYLENRTPKGCR